MAAMRMAPPAHMTYEEFLKADFGEQRVEWVDGEIEYMGTVAREHSELAGWLYAVIRFLCEFHRLGSVFFEPFNMRLPKRPSGRNPDVLFVAAQHAERIKRNHVDGPADLVIEVGNPDDRSRDLVVKRSEYEQAGVPEYWILDPDRKEAVFLVLGEDGHYSTADPDDDGVYRSGAIEGLWIKVDWLFQQPLPPMLDILKAWKLVP